jgi:ferric-dicitrate binding protein FerR (iron transport regulator)
MNRFEDLTARYYENHLDDGESKELRDLLDGSPDLLREFVITGIREEQLKAALRRSSALEGSIPLIGRRARPGKLRILWFAAAAVLAISVLAWIHMTRGVEVEVIASRDVQVSKGCLSPETGSRSRVRDLTLEKGVLKLRLAHDVSIELLAPAQLRFIDPRHVRILSGKATVDVGQHGKGFILDAPQTRVVDLGTRFGVDASAADSTGVVVIEGSVELHSRQGKVNHLAEGEGVVVNTAGAIGKLDQVRFNPGTGQWSTGALDDGSSLIRSVRNNQKDQSVYHIVAGGLVESVPAHHNRNARWVSLPERPIPSWLFGADLVLPVHDHRDRANLRVTVKVAASTSLFVFQRRNQPAPSWLVEDFVPTGERIGKVSIEKHRDNKPVSFDIWRRDMPEGGEVVLGPAARPGSLSGGTIHYGIAALPLGSAPRAPHPNH